VVLTRATETLEQYRRVERTGRGRVLGPRQRGQLWPGLWEFGSELAQRRLWTYETMCVEATRWVEQSTAKPYRHAIIDEAQDVSPLQWRLLRAAVQPGPDDLFIAGDTHQRIYDHRISLREVGILSPGARPC
jgi:hypothetical protein